MADAHFKRGDSALISYFSRIPNGVQIFLMGDIFHLLVGSIKSSLKDNFALLELLFKMSFTHEIIYVEGNHDFGLKAAFQRLFAMESVRKDSIESKMQKVSNIRIFRYKNQPLIMRDYQNNLCILAHGDRWISPFYDFYRGFIDSRALLFCYKILDSITFGRLYKRFSLRISRREVREFSYFRSDFTNFMKDRIMKYRTFVINKIIESNLDSKNICIIEGHFHLGQNLTESYEITNFLIESNALDSKDSKESNMPDSKKVSKLDSIESNVLDSKKDSKSVKKTITIYYNSLSSQYAHKSYYTLQNAKITQTKF